VLLDLITVKFWLSSLTKPLQVFGMLGLASLWVGVATCVYLAALKIIWGLSLADRPLLFFGILLMVIGVQFLCLGILAEVQIRTYHESSRKLIYTVREVLDSHNAAINIVDRTQSDETVLSNAYRASKEIRGA
jgi:hypothetical protein